MQPVNQGANLPVIDLSTCENEPIHIPGRIQSHGFLLAVNRKTGILEYCSDNSSHFISTDAVTFLNRPFSDFIDATNIEAGYADLQRLVNPKQKIDFETINPLLVQVSGKKYNLIVEPSDGHMLFEFEPQQEVIGIELERLVGISLSRILEAKTLDQTLQYAASQVKDIIGYDRVMIYKFWDDEHGEVVAEERNEDLEPFLGLHYPASDIPKQARELYKINLVRIIADVHSMSASLLAVSDRPLDLTHSVLRAVSPIHIEYLKNMGVAASFSISIVVKDKLWGLIACHNYSPRFIDYKARNSAKLIGKILSSSIEFRDERERKELGAEFNQVLQKMIGLASREWDIADSLVNHEDNILRLTHATGAALMFENNLYTLGETPGEEQIYALAKWLKLNNQPTLFHTDQLPKMYAPAEEFREIGSGFLSCTLSRELNEHIFWFKPELKKTVKWAGNPDKPVEIDEEGKTRLSPRRSFELWQQEVEGASAPWSSVEIGAVMKLREEVTQLINQKANQIRRLNEELQKAYDELDTFSFTISHDLKTPLASIKNYSEILLEDHQDLPEAVTEILGKIIRNADRMNLLIREVLSYSRIDRQEMNFKRLDMKNMISTVVHEAVAAQQATNTKITVEGTPSIEGDSTMIYQVFMNVITNAVKYSAKSENPVVEIRGRETPEEVIYTVRDNGIGIDMNYGNQVFVLFKRLENARKYEGTGVGLAIVKRIMEKHKAKIWYENAPERGTIFYLLFRK